MKIGLVCPYSFFRPGGVQQVIVQHYKELKKLGHEVKIITFRAKEEGDLEFFGEDLIYVGNLFEFPFLSTLVAVSFVQNKTDFDKLDKIDFDVVHLHEAWVPFGPVQLVRYFRKRQIKIVSTFHSTPSESLFAKILLTIATPYLRWTMGKVDRAITVSNSPMKFISRGYKKKIYHNPPGLHVATFKEERKMEEYLDGKLNILFLGRLEERKGVIFALKAFAKVAQTNPNIRLIIAGKGNLEESLKKYVKQKAIQNVEFLGYVSDEQKKILYNTCDIYLSPAMFGESFGIVLLEAMAFGKPLIAGNNAGYKYPLTGLGSYQLVDTADIELFSHRLRALVESDQLRKLLGEWGLQRVKDFDYPNLVDDLVSIYKS